MSQYELGKAIGVSKKTISKWETEQGRPSKANLRKLEELFHVSLNEGYRDVTDWGTFPLDGAPGEEKACVVRRLKAEYAYLKDRMLQLKDLMAAVEGQPI